MVYTKTTWLTGDLISAAKLTNMELQYDDAKADFGGIAATITVAKEGESLHAYGADYLVAIGDTSAETTINAAIDAAVAVGGGTVLLLEGIYTVDGSILLKDNITFRGMGPATIVKPMDGMGADLKIIYHATVAAPGNKNMVVRDLAIDGNIDNETFGTIGISFLNCTDTASKILIRNVSFLNPSTAGGYGLSAISSKNIIVDACSSFGGNVGQGVLFSSCVDCQVVNSSFSELAAGVTIMTCTDCIVLGNVGYAVSAGIYVAASVRIDISENIISDSVIGIYMSGSTYCNLSGNVCKNNSSVGIQLAANSHYPTISSNVCAGNGYGIYIANSSALLVNANTATTSTNDGIVITNSTYSEVTNNISYLNQKCGINLAGFSYSSAVGNNASVNGQATNATYANIDINTVSDYSTITANICHKGAGPVYPSYGINIHAGCVSNLVTANMLVASGTTGTLLDNGTTTDKTGWLVAGNKIA